MLTYMYRPSIFFSLTFFISWVAWFLAAYVSWQPAMQQFLLPLVLLGISGPAITTFIMLIRANNASLWQDFFQRLRFSSIKKRFIPIVVFLVPCQILLAIAIAWFFGESIHQAVPATDMADQALQGITLLMSLFVIFLVGPFEEIGWRGYGIDSLRSKFSLMKTSLIFGALWGCWHLPLFLIKNGSFQEIWSFGLLHTAVYFTVFFFLTIIINWLYIKNNRSILIAILFHSICDLCIGLFHITPVTWTVLAGILLLTAVIVVRQNKDVFFKKLESSHN